MTKKLVLSVAMLAVGAGLLVASATAGNAGKASATAPQGKSATGAVGGTFKINLQSDVDYVDPALAYYIVSWQLEFATCAKLLNYPDKDAPAGSQLVPDATTGLPAVSSDGKTYTFTIKPGIKSNKGTELTAANFKAAINRDLNPKMQSPAGPFISDVAGAQAVLDGKAATASGVTTPSKYKLVIKMAQAAPDLLARIAMPFFCAIPTNLPIVPEGVNTLEAWGPYYVSERTPNRSIVLTKNPNYKGSRPHNVQQVTYNVGVSLEASQLQVQQGSVDYAGDGINPTAYADIAAKYGVNKSQFWVKPLLQFRYLALNTAQPLFKNNVKLRRAVGYAIDRPALVRLRGAFGGQRATHFLPPGMPGYVKSNVYPIKGSDYVTAKKLADGNTRGGKATMYTCNAGNCLTAAPVLQFNLKQIGIDLDVVKYSRSVQFEKEGIKGEQFDIGFESWGADYADPFDFINILLDGTTIRDTNNVNFSYFNDPAYNKKMQDAAKLSGATRYGSYGKLDIDIAGKQAPLVSWIYGNQRDFVAARVKNYVFNPVYGMSIGAISVS